MIDATEDPLLDQILSHYEEDLRWIEKGSITEVEVRGFDDEGVCHGSAAVSPGEDISDARVGEMAKENWGEEPTWIIWFRPDTEPTRLVALNPKTGDIVESLPSDKDQRSRSVRQELRAD